MEKKDKIFNRKGQIITVVTFFVTWVIYSWLSNEIPWSLFAAFLSAGFAAITYAVFRMFSLASK